MSSYTLTQAEFVRLKRRLTTRTNKLQKAYTEHCHKRHDAERRKAVVKEAEAVVKEVDYAMAIFDEKGAPDQWHNWERAKDDAKTKIQILSGF